MTADRQATVRTVALLVPLWLVLAALGMHHAWEKCFAGRTRWKVC